MPAYTQAGRPAQVTTPLGADALLLAGFSSREAISEMFEFRLELLAELETPVPFERLMGQEMTVEFTAPDGNTRWFSGMVRRLTREGQGDNFASYTAELAPSVWRLTKCVRSRIFQQKTVQQILQTVFADQTIEFRLTGQYFAHNYCVQFEESDFAFATRLMEEEGIHYYFTHSADGHRLIVADDSPNNPKLPQQSSVRFDATEGVVRKHGRIRRWCKSQQLCAGGYTLRDHCFEMPGRDSTATEPIADQLMAGTFAHSLGAGADSTMTLSEYPGGYVHRFDGIDPSGDEQASSLEGIFTDNERTAKLRMQQETSDAVVIEGVGECGRFTPGYSFSLVDHEDGDGGYLLTRVTQKVTLPDYRTTSDEVGEYENAFECVPVELQYRPKRTTPRPIVHGVETATVVGVGAEEIFTDKYGRVKVQFHWYQEDGSEPNSCWLRVAQSWAGGNWGAVTVPRVGQEVVVGFRHGDPDAPLVLGSVYNADQMPPFEFPADATRSGMKTQSRGGDSTNYSGLAFEDQLGSEYVQLHSERDLFSSAENSHQHVVPNTHREAVGRSRIRTVGSLPGSSSTGSGSGGGALSSWEPPEVDAGFGTAYELTIGAEIVTTVGWHSDFNIGTYAEVIINPGGLGFLLAGAGPAGAAFAAAVATSITVGAIVGGVAGAATGGDSIQITEDTLLGSLVGVAEVAGGSVEVTYGFKNELCYGPLTECVHGPKFEYHGKMPGTEGLVVKTLAAALGVSFVAAATVPAFLGDEDTAIITELGLTNLNALLLNGLLMAEKALFDAQAIELKAAEAAEITASVTVREIPEFAAAVLEAAKNKIIDAKDLAEKAIADAEEAARAATGAAETAAEASEAGDATLEALTTLANQAVKNVNGDYTINAENISVNSTPALPATASNITMTANGAEGSLNLSGENLAQLAAGGGTIGVTSTEEGVAGEIILQGGVAGKLNLRLDPVGQLAQIAIDSEGITISTAATPISLQTAEGVVQVKLTPDSMTLMAPSISMVAEEAIVMQVDGTNLTIDAEGIQSERGALTVATELEEVRDSVSETKDLAEFALNVGLTTIQ